MSVPTWSKRSLMLLCQLGTLGCGAGHPIARADQHAERASAEIALDAQPAGAEITPEVIEPAFEAPPETLLGIWLRCTILLGANDDVETARVVPVHMRPRSELEVRVEQIAGAWTETVRESGEPVRARPFPRSSVDAVEEVLRHIDGAPGGSCPGSLRVSTTQRQLEISICSREGTRIIGLLRERCRQ